ncbi:hypothetical protein SAMN04487915_103370 [Arthrobacter sp. ov118]|nr:hypothetical protein SAMN04487915_103370 [Arthrobacter sp. ov118]
MSRLSRKERAVWVHVRWLSAGTDMPILWHRLRGTCPFLEWRPWAAGNLAAGCPPKRGHARFGSGCGAHVHSSGEVVGSHGTCPVVGRASGHVRRMEGAARDMSGGSPTRATCPFVGRDHRGHVQWLPRGVGNYGPCPLVVRCVGYVHSLARAARNMSILQMASWDGGDMSSGSTVCAGPRCARDMALVGADPGGHDQFSGQTPVPLQSPARLSGRGFPRRVGCGRVSDVCVAALIAGDRLACVRVYYSATFADPARAAAAGGGHDE